MTDIPLKKSLLGLVAVCCTALAGIAAAQGPSVRFGLGGGATAPVGDYQDGSSERHHLDQERRTRRPAEARDA